MQPSGDEDEPPELHHAVHAIKGSPRHHPRPRPRPIACRFKVKSTKKSIVLDIPSVDMPFVSIQ